jgi:segregation and condensation protein B
MSLKAKLEAVIYAAEEPVTLTQLAAIFAADALEWKAEQEAALAEEAFAEASPSLLDEEQAEFPTSEEDEAEITPSAEPDLEIAEVAPDGLDSAAVSEASAASFLTAPQPAEEESELKRQARQRDREVRTILRQLLDQIIATYASDDHGVEIREIAGGFRMATKPECHDAVRLFVKSLKPAMKLSLAALETLAVIAYKQPVTSPEVSDIRGVESAGVLGSLLARKLIATAGRKPVIGRPILYKTTKEFLLRFGLKEISELPSMEEFEKMAAIELEEPEPQADDATELSSEAAQLLQPDQSSESEEDSDQKGENSPIDQKDVGPTPAPFAAEEQSAPAPELSASTPAVTAAQYPEEAPAGMAAANEPPNEAE